MKRILCAVLCLVMLISAVLPVNVSAATKPMPFTDVPKDAWYYKSVLWAWNEGLVAGKTETMFGPNDTCTHAEFLTILYRYVGQPKLRTEEEKRPVLSDVKEDAWYYDAVMWAIEAGVARGKYDGKFGANMVLSRETMMSYVYNCYCFYLQKPAYSNTLSDNTVFTDKSKVSSWALVGVSWCVDNAVIAGTSARTLSPLENVTRAQAVCVLMRCKDAFDGHLWSAQTIKIEPTCVMYGSEYRTCTKCGARHLFRIYEKLNHDWTKIKITKEATRSNPVKYKRVCSNCGKVEKTERSLGYAQNGKKPARDVAKVTYPITLSSGSATAEITRKWWGGSWCYIAHMTLPKGQTKHWTGADAQTSSGASTTRTGLDEAKLLKALVLINGDANNGGIESDGYWARARNGKFYGRDLYRSWANYWNKNTGAYGRCGDLGESIKTLVDKGKITDTAAFWSGLFVYKGKIRVTEEKSPDNRRQRTFMGFKTVGTTVHVYAVVCDGWTGQGKTPYDLTFSNDGSSYGMTSFEETLLLASLGCDYGIPLDGGHSSVMVVKNGNSYIELNAATYHMPGYSAVGRRSLWDFWYFK